MPCSPVIEKTTGAGVTVRYHEIISRGNCKRKPFIERIYHIDAHDAKHGKLPEFGVSSKF
jgi:hypothetical protein